MNDASRKTRELFPNMPEEIFQLWLESESQPLIERHGVPADDSCAWKWILLHKGVDYWRQLVWTEEDIRLYDIEFSERSKAALTFAGCEEKTRRIWQYFEKHKILPGKLILIEENTEYGLADGHHRVACFNVRMQDQSVKQEIKQSLRGNFQAAWVGRLPT